MSTLATPGLVTEGVIRVEGLEVGGWGAQQGAVLGRARGDTVGPGVPGVGGHHGGHVALGALVMLVEPGLLVGVPRLLGGPGGLASPGGPGALASPGGPRAACLLGVRVRKDD